MDTDPEHCLKSLTRGDKSEPVTVGESACRRSHRLQSDIILVLRCEDLGVTVTSEQFHTDFASSASDGESCPLVRQGKTIVETPFTKSGIQSANGLLVTRRDAASVEQKFPHRGQ